MDKISVEKTFNVAYYPSVETSFTLLPLSPFQLVSGAASSGGGGGPAILGNRKPGAARFVTASKSVGGAPGLRAAIGGGATQVIAIKSEAASN